MPVPLIVFDTGWLRRGISDVEEKQRTNGRGNRAFPAISPPYLLDNPQAKLTASDEKFIERMLRIAREDFEREGSVGLRKLKQ